MSGGTKPLGSLNIARLVAVVTVMAVLFLFLPARLSGAQDGATATPDGGEAVGTVEVRQPALNPPFVSGAEPGWLRISGKSAHTIYAVRNAAAGPEGVFSGAWRSSIPAAGYYRVEAYIGVGEVLEYAKLQPEGGPDIPPLTRSARYLVTHAGSTTPVEVDQARRGSEWVDLGVFFFEAGDAETTLVELDNQTAEEAGQTLVTFSTLRFTSTGAPAPTATIRPSPTTTHTPTASLPPALTLTATPSPTTPLTEIDALELGEATFTTGPDGIVQAQVPLFIDGQRVGTIDYSYPETMAPQSAGQIEVAITVTDNFTSTVDVLVRDLTQGVAIGSRTLVSRFSLSLDAQTFEFDQDFKTQTVDVSTIREAAALWNIVAEPGVGGEDGEDVNIKLVLGFDERGIPTITGKPLAFKIRVLAPATVTVATTTPAAPASPAAPADGPFGSPLVPVLCGVGLLVALVIAIFLYLDRRRKGPSGETAVVAARLEGDEQIRLYQMLTEHFDEQGLRELSFLMKIDYEDLPFPGKSNKARELVALCADAGRLGALADLIREKRPRLFAGQPEDEGPEAGNGADNG